MRDVDDADNQRKNSFSKILALITTEKCKLTVNNPQLLTP